MSSSSLQRFTLDWFFCARRRFFPSWWLFCASSWSITISSCWSIQRDVSFSIVIRRASRWIRPRPSPVGLWRFPGLRLFNRRWTPNESARAFRFSPRPFLFCFPSVFFSLSPFIEISICTVKQRPTSAIASSRNWIWARSSRNVKIKVRIGFRPRRETSRRWSFTSRGRTRRMPTTSCARVAYANLGCVWPAMANITRICAETATKNRINAINHVREQFSSNDRISDGMTTIKITLELDSTDKTSFFSERTNE